MISVCCPSRSRPDFAAKLYKNIKDTAGGDFEVLFHIDNDDPTFPDYEGLCPEARLIRGDRHVLGTLYNRLWKESKGDLLLMTGDDIYFTTSGWAKKVEKVYARYFDKICFIGGGKSAHFIGPTYLFVSRRVCEILGYLAPPWLNRWIDIWLWEIAKEIGRMITIDAQGDHIHPTTGGRKPDQVFMDLQTTLSQDHRMFLEAKHVRQFDIEILKKKMIKDVAFM